MDAREAVKIDPKGGKGWVRLGDGLVAKGGDEKKEAEEACEFPRRVSSLSSDTRAD